MTKSFSISISSVACEQKFADISWIFAIIHVTLHNWIPYISLSQVWLRSYIHKYYLKWRYYYCINGFSIDLVKCACNPIHVFWLKCVADAFWMWERDIWGNIYPLDDANGFISFGYVMITFNLTRNSAFLDVSCLVSN